VESGRSSAYSKEYHAQHREERIAYAKQNYQKNINLNRRKAIENRRQKADYYREYNRIYQNKHKVNRAIRSGLYGCLMGRKKSSKSFDYIGLSPAAFKLHLESLFLPGMTWENYGNPNGDHTECWHIDHKIPIASFCLDVLNGERLEQALHEAWHYSNLQPLWAKDNLSKGDRLL
jgi:5-methylcytosine-specific restriction endonuclease McrA